MRFVIEVCPRCGRRPTAIVQKILAHYGILRDADGDWNYSDDTVHFDEGAEDLVDGKTTLHCAEGHDWETDRVFGSS